MTRLQLHPRSILKENYMSELLDFVNPVLVGLLMGLETRNFTYGLVTYFVISLLMRIVNKQ